MVVYNLIYFFTKQYNDIFFVLNNAFVFIFSNSVCKNNYDDAKIACEAKFYKSPKFQDLS